MGLIELQKYIQNPHCNAAYFKKSQIKKEKNKIEKWNSASFQKDKNSYFFIIQQIKFVCKRPLLTFYTFKKFTFFHKKRRQYAVFDCRKSTITETYCLFRRNYFFAAGVAVGAADSATVSFSTIPFNPAAKPANP